MTGFRNKKRVNPFVQIDKNILSDKQLSWKAKGILVYLLSKPDDWVTYLTDIENQSTDGRDSVSSGVKELLSAGYLERKQLREKGRFKGWEYSVYECPNVSESTENGKPENGNADYGKAVNGLSENGKPPTSNNDLTNNDLTNNNYNDNNAHANDHSDVSENHKPKENPFSFYESNGFGALGKHIGDKIGFWMDDLNDELVLKAMQIAVENGANNWNYVEKILIDWMAKGFKSISDYEAHELKRAQKRQRQVAPRPNYRNAPVKEAPMPDWLKKQKEEQAAKESNAQTSAVDPDIEERRRQLREELSRSRSNFEGKGINK